MAQSWRWRGFMFPVAVERIGRKKNRNQRTVFWAMGWAGGSVNGSIQYGPLGQPIHTESSSVSRVYSTRLVDRCLPAAAGRRRACDYLPHLKFWASSATEGDPLSPYIFILAIDTLHQLFELATEEGELTELRGRHASIRLL